MLSVSHSEGLLNRKRCEVRAMYDIEKNPSVLIIALKEFVKGYGSEKIYSLVSENDFDTTKCLTDVRSSVGSDLIDEKLMLADKLYQNNLKKGIGFISLLDRDFPDKLYASDDKCIGLYYKGDRKLLNTKSVAVIGTRKPDNEFIEKGKIVVKRLVEGGFTIVSGLAIGSDAAAHRACLDAGGKTIAVLPSTCDVIYPSTNRKLADEIVANGGLLVSEYTGDTNPAYNFVKRDRIQSFLSDAVIVIQANDNGGTRHAVFRSQKDGKYVCAIEGNNLTIVNNFINPYDDNLLNIVKKRNISTKQMKLF